MKLKKEKRIKDKCKVTLPDNTSIDIGMFIDLNGVFDNNDFTNFLLNRYKETLCGLII